MSNRKAGPSRRVKKRGYQSFNVDAAFAPSLYYFQRPQKKHPNSVCNYPVYLIMKDEYLFRLVKEKALFLNNIQSNWTDVYELFFVKNKFHYLESKEEINPYKHFAYAVYGQSWSYNKSSDAMWRIYSQPRKNNVLYGKELDQDPTATIEEYESCGVRIRTSLQKLYSVLKKNSLNKTETLMGNILYMEPRDLQKWNRKHRRVNVADYGRIFKESIFIKRDNFRHENEMRVVVLVPFVLGQQSELSEMIQLPLDNPLDFIEEIAVDPRLKPEIAEKEMQRISKEIGCDRKLLKQSSLYKYVSQRVELIK